MQCNLLAGGVVFTFKIAHDERVRRLGPGVALEVDLLQRFHADPALSSMDSCAAHDNEMINRLWPDRRTVSTTLIPTGTPLGRGARRALATAIRIRDKEGAHARAAGDRPD
jgi:hypothetical protein